ncbi:MAG: hypothetical protein BGO23_10535 [Solirubrobacterales bacterium 67-14]|nr:MAG: hypothetical protein BGO23_10535 [Solirubrobacterales bacterium 67-14]
MAEQLEGDGHRGGWLRDERVVWAAVGLITLIGLGLRIHRYSQGLFGDELSTLWVVRGNGLSKVLSTVHSDAEITPPLYFVLAWLSVKLGSAPELVRLPALIAGVAVIPSIFALGRRLIGTQAGLLTAAIVALSPFLINGSGEGRGYSTMILALVLAAFCLLRAGDGKGKLWWFGWGLFSCLAIYSHYTAVFVVAAMFAWSLWAQPAGRRWLLAAALLAALAYLPWLSGYLADSDSPTTQLVAILTEFDLKSIVTNPILLVFGSPYMSPSVREVMTGGPGPILALAGILIAAAGALVSVVRSRREAVESVGSGENSHPDRRDAVLVILLLLAVPVGEILYSAASSDIFGLRNLTAAWPGVALFIGMVVAVNGPRLRIATGLTVLLGFALMGIGTLDRDRAMPDYGPAASWAEREAGDDGVIVEETILQGSPTPLTPLAVQLDPRRPDFQLGLPQGPPPFYFPNAPDEWELWRQALAKAKDSRLVLVEPRLLDQSIWETTKPNWVSYDFGDRALAELPKGYEIEATRTFPGIVPLKVTVVDGPDAP